MDAERGRVGETIWHEGGRSHPADCVCLRCVGEVVEQRDAALRECAALKADVQRLQAQWDRLQRGLAPPFVAGAAWPVGEE